MIYVETTKGGDDLNDHRLQPATKHTLERTRWKVRQ